MSKFFNSLRMFLSILAVCYITSCIHTKPIPNRIMESEEGIKALAVNIGEQLEKSSIGNLLNKVVINPLTKQKELKKIVIDPFIDVESGYPVKVNTMISEIISQELQKRFEITGQMEPDNLEVSEYVLNGMVTLEEKHKGQENYKIYGTVFEKSSGKVLAAASVRVNRFDTTPMDIYKDSPVFMKGKNYGQYTSSVRKMPNETVETGYHDRLMIKSMLVKGDMLYEHKEYRKSLSYYMQAAGSQSGLQLEVLNGQFANLIKQSRWEEAENIYAKLIGASIAETGEIASKITFVPNSVVPIETKVNLYNIYMKQIAKLAAGIPGCRIKIIGHCSRTGTEAYNDNLSLQRALWIQKYMASYVPEIMDKSEAIGLGFRENIVGTGTDDITDEIDRRVEFEFSQCVE